MLPPLVPKPAVVSSPHKDYFDLTNTWVLAAVVGGILVLYSLSRIISLQRRIRDLEGRPPVDDIVMRGMIRHEVREIVEEQEEKRAVFKYDMPPKPVPSVQTMAPSVVQTVAPSVVQTVAPSVVQTVSPSVIKAVAPDYIDKTVFEVTFEEKLDSPIESQVSDKSDEIKVEIMGPKKKVKKALK